MQIFVKTLSAATISLDIDVDGGIELVKNKVALREGCQLADVFLNFGGCPLENGRSLRDYGIQKESTLHQSGRLLGGHCQVPCGIFDDPKLVTEVKEACQTIRKMITLLQEACKEVTQAESFNKMSRLTSTKEQHAGQIINLMTEYCLAQRVKPVGAPKSPFTTDAEYIEALKAHHAVMLAAVSCKQSAELSAVDALDAAVSTMSAMYMPAAALKAADSVPVAFANDAPAAPAAPKETTCGSCVIH
eukprot:TRINITY_DN11748_c0_g1_i1.p1 TRINITY_DN11748_c0_g1~~TRINITY_DN11748_c0_g1_i1.p1  ORF type:complete len:246 (+),score=63.75 TRINITY_DN11748_c0_g1_i1:91-828(+)